MTGRIWTPGPASTSRDGYRCQDPLSTWPRITWLTGRSSLLIQKSQIWINPRYSVGFSTGRLKFWAICPIAIFTWGKLILSYVGGMDSLIVQLLKKLPAMLETCVWSLSLEDLLETGKTTHSRILAWRIPWTLVHGAEKIWIQTEGISLSLLRKDWVEERIR